MSKGIERFWIDDKETPHGVGANKMVHNDKLNPERVIGMSKYGSESYPVSRFYLIKLLHMLFPKNIPDIHFSFQKSGLARRTKADMGDDHEVIRLWELACDGYIPKNDERDDVSWEKAHEKISNDPRVSVLQDELEALGIQYEWGGKNFGFDKEGNAIYVDNLIENNFASVMPKLESAIQSLPPEDQKQARMYLDRLKNAFEKEI